MKYPEIRYENITAIVALTVGIAAMMLPSASLVSTVFAQSHNQGASEHADRALNEVINIQKQASDEITKAIIGHVERR